MKLKVIRPVKTKKETPKKREKINPKALLEKHRKSYCDEVHETLE